MGGVGVEQRYILQFVGAKKQSQEYQAVVYSQECLGSVRFECEDPINCQNLRFHHEHQRVNTRFIKIPTGVIQ
jgi:hypothetical protein